MPEKPKFKTRTGRHARRMDGENKISVEDARASNSNVLMAQYIRSGTLPRVPEKNPLYGNFTAPADLASQLEAVATAQDTFSQLPASVRDASGYDMVRFLEMVEDPQQRALLQEAGLVIPDHPEYEPPSPSSDSSLPSSPDEEAPPPDDGTS